MLALMSSHNRPPLTAWFNVARPGQYHELHHHAGAPWSGVYWVTAPSAPPSPCEHSGALVLQLGVIHATVDGIDGADGTLAKPLCRYAVMRPLPGTALFFPGWLPHAVLPLAPSPDGHGSATTVKSTDGGNLRVSISFNSSTA